MDFHLLIVISCVFLGSLLSLLFINKFFRRKTFEEVIAEKKALTEKIYGQNKVALKKTKKLQQLSKKELKREKKQRQKEQQQQQQSNHDNNTEQDESDAQSEQLSTVDDEPEGLSKVHVEFEPDPEVINVNSKTQKTAGGNVVDKENIAANANNGSGGIGGSKHKLNKKDKNRGNKPTAGILINKNEPVAIKDEANIADEQLNNFDTKPPKDVVELKKHEPKEKRDDKHHAQQQQQQQQQQQAGATNKKEKNVKKDKEKHAIEKLAQEKLVEPQQQQQQQQQHAAQSHNQQTAQQSSETINVTNSLVKDVKHVEEKVRHGSPKIQQQQQHNLHNNNNNNNSNNNNNNNNSNSNSNKNKQSNKKHNKENNATKDLVQSLDKLSESDTIGVSLLMNLFRRAELNRSEIQLLIDYLLNKQQDMPSTHSEWSDDICQKLKRQLLEKERALAEEQEASIGIQAKLRELRLEINNERAHMNATVKAYVEKLQGKDQEIAALNQELQSLNEKLTIERQQFQTKLIREKQAGSQDLLGQIQLLKNELALKDKSIGELTHMFNASRQAVDELQQKHEMLQAQLRALEQQRDELEQVNNNRIFELEQAKTLETENSELKVELLNLQNAIESSKIDLQQTRKDLEITKSELQLARSVELSEKQQEIQLLQAKNEDLLQQLAGINNRTEQQTQEQASLQVTLDALKTQLAARDAQLTDTHTENANLQQQLSGAERLAEETQIHAGQQQKLVERLNADLASKNKQLQQIEQNAEKFTKRENELLQQLQEQREKNNDLRMKNWKLIEALQNAETTAKQNKTLSSANRNLVQQEQLLAATQKLTSNTTTAIGTATVATATTNDNANVADEQKHVRELFQRLYPDAVKACAGTALSASFDQWVEQVLATYIKQSISKTINNNTNTNTATTTTTTANSNCNKSTQSSNSNNHNSTYNSRDDDDNNLSNSEITTNNNNSCSRSSNDSTSSNNGSNAADCAEMQKLYTQNAQLRAKVDELTKLVTKTSNTLSDLENRAREQDESWRSIVHSKDQQIYMLQHSNGEQDI